MAGPRRVRVFFSELARRRVGRVAVGYAVTAWVLIEVSDVVFPRLGLPEWGVTFLILTAVAGFPVAVALAWFFDVVPERASPEKGAATRIGAWRGVGLVGLVAVVSGAATIGVWSLVTGEAPNIRSLAVLPLANLSDDPEQQFFVDGMHDALIGELAQIGSIRVISRTSTLRFRESTKSMAEIARDLDVDGLVEGTVLKVGDEVRMQVQLIDPLPRERHVWAAGYERHVRDVYAMHAAIARSIASEIRAGMTPRESERLSTTRSVDPRAYEAYLLGMFHLRRQTSEGYRTGLNYLLESVELDPEHPAAHAGLALGYSLIGHGTVPDAFERAMAAARRALELDPTFGDAHQAIAEYKLYSEWDWTGAESAFKKALSFKPNSANAAGHYAWYLEMKRRPQEALEWMRRAVALDPLDATWSAWVAWLYWDAERWEEALVEARKALEIDRNHPHARYLVATSSAILGDAETALAVAGQLPEAGAVWAWGLAHTHAILGREQAAMELIRELERMSSNPMAAWGLAVTYAELGRVEEAITWLETAHALRFSWMPWVDRWYMFRPLRGDPRFEAIRAALKLPGTELQIVAAR